MKLPFVVIESLVGPEICNRAVQRFKAGQFEPATVGGNESEVTNPNIRITDRQWAPQFDVLECILSRVTSKANIDAGWNFDITDVNGCVQIARYKVGHFYTAHIDSYYGSASNGGPQRKLSASLFLSSEDEYDGGDLVIAGEKVETKKQGTIVVFPSFMVHEVLPVTRGERYSAVCWMEGPEWK